MKVAGSYPSLLRGVSQQPPEVRLPGQHKEQINFVSDPVAGLTRRRGTVKKVSQRIIGLNRPFDELSARVQDYQIYEHNDGTKDYVILIKKYTGLSNIWSYGVDPPVVVGYNITDNVFMTLAGDAGTIQTAEYLRTGTRAACSLGRIMVVAPSPETATVGSRQQLWQTNARTHCIVWIRGGAYDRQYSLNMPGSVISYATPAAGTTGAATAISPENIANAIAAAINAAGIYTAARMGSHIHIQRVDGGLMGEVSASDGGDGTLIRSVTSVVDSVDKLPIMGIHDQMVRIQTGPDTGFYVKASTKNPTAPILSEARWVEAAGEVYVPNQNALMGLTVISNVIYMSPQVNGLPLSNPVPPTLLSSVVGDIASAKPPRFMTTPMGSITYLGVFQDRFLVGSGAALAVSAAGDYFNFFRSTMLTVPQSDGFEMTSMGGEDDSLRSGVTYNKDLVIFGDKRQYSISGTTPLSPLSPNLAPMSALAFAATTRPLAAGGQIFYARDNDGYVGLHQIQPGTFTDGAESFPNSAQISNYIPAPVNQLSHLPGAPAFVTVRSRSAPRSLWVFSYLDQPDGRKQDAWYRWDFHRECGALVGVHHTPAGLLLFWVRTTGGLLYNDFVVDLMPSGALNNGTPHLDSMRPYSTVPATLTAASEITLAGKAGWKAAYRTPSPRAYIGDDLSDIGAIVAQYPDQSANLAVGISFDSSVTATNPYLRDGAGQAVLGGRLVITKMTLNLRDTAGLEAIIEHGQTVKSYPFNARVMGNILNNIGVVPLLTDRHDVAIGRAHTEYTFTIKALDWRPLTIVGMEWTGQSFNRTPRA